VLREGRASVLVFPEQRRQDNESFQTLQPTNISYCPYGSPKANKFVYAWCSKQSYRKYNEHSVIWHTYSEWKKRRGVGIHSTMLIYLCPGLFLLSAITRTRVGLGWPEVGSERSRVNTEQETGFDVDLYNLRTLTAFILFYHFTGTNAT